MATHVEKSSFAGGCVCFLEGKRGKVTAADIECLITTGRLTPPPLEATLVIFGRSVFCLKALGKI